MQAAKCVYISLTVGALSQKYMNVAAPIATPLGSTRAINNHGECFNNQRVQRTFRQLASRWSCVRLRGSNKWHRSQHSLKARRHARITPNLLPLLRQSPAPRVLSVLNAGNEAPMCDSDIGG